MTYEETVELEKNIKLKNEADSLYQKFLKGAKLEVSKFIGNNTFIIWKDSHNRELIKIEDDKFFFICEFLHENYKIEITPSGLFNAIQKDDRGIAHLKVYLQ